MKLHRKCLTVLTLFTSLAWTVAPANASPLARCAARTSVEAKIAACTVASRSTPYPWILHWVHRELARAHRDRGDTSSALISYARSLAAAEREEVRMEMAELTALLLIQ